MSFLKSIFGIKSEKSMAEVTVQIHSNHNVETPQKSISSNIQNLVLLSVAEQFIVGEKKYPDYLRYQFGIGFPNEKLDKLEKESYIRSTTAAETLPRLKIAELKTIASQFDLKVSGKKADLCDRIAENVPEADLDRIITERYWTVTEKGKTFLAENPYISFYLERHAYSLEDIGLDINTYAKLFSGHPGGNIRDIIWGELNRRSLDGYSKGIRKGEFSDYCKLLHTMALFLEEENRHIDALNMYMRYIYYRANFEAGISALKCYSYLKKVDSAADKLYMDAEIYPFIADEIISMSDACEFDSRQLQAYMKETFSKETDTGAFSPDELTRFVMCGLNGNQDGQKRICKSVMQSAVRKLPKK